MSEGLEANFGTPESPLLSMNAIRTSTSFTVASNIVVESPGLELTPRPIDVMNRMRVFFIALRSLRAFAQAGDAIAENKNELMDELLGSSPSHMAVDIDSPSQILDPDCISNLVRSQNIEQLRQFGGVEKVASALVTDTQNGIHEESIPERRRNFGPNTIEKAPPKILQIVLETTGDPIIIILLFCAVLAFGFGVIKHGLKGWYDGGSIFLAVFVVIAVTAYCKIWPRSQVFKLSRASDDFTIDVIRNGQEHRISVFDAVVGDVICLKLGDQVPADGLYIYGNSLQLVDESNMTEAMVSPKLKDNNDPFLLSGSQVTNGSARMLATAVGMKTARVNMLNSNCQKTDQNTPLQMKLHKLAMLIAKIGLVAAFLVLLVLLVRYFRGAMRDEHGKPEFLAGKTRFHNVCKFMIGILVTPLAIASTAIPEGLLLAVTIPIAYSTHRMAVAQKALVRKLSAWEEIGSTTVICTNERGILTTHKLEVSRFWFGQDTFSSIAPNVRELLLQGVVSGNTLVSPGSLAESIQLAIQDWAFQQMRLDVDQVRANCTIPHQRGDPEDVLANCSQYYDECGHIKKISDEVRKNLEQMILKMKSKRLQCIAFSCSDLSEDNEDGNENFHPNLKEECFTFIGFVGLTYPCLPEIKKAVVDCQGAGVNIKLVTRSDLPAARAIAFECGILDPNQDTTTGEVVEGLDFQNYPEEERLEKSDKIRVMARASTLHRLLMVKDLKLKGHKVAVTGDTLGDAAVFKEADVGLSLGIQGTNIAKENSDIIILNDSFDSLATALRWGRGMYFKIQMYTQFQLIVSISSLVVDFVTAISAREPPTIKIVAVISAGEVPFAALQVLWVKLIVGALASLAITIEEPAEELQQLPSVNKTQPFVTKIMWRNIVGQALYPIIILLTINFKGQSVFNLDANVKETVIFNILVLWQLFTIFTTKRFEINIIKWIRREKLFWTIVGTIISVQVLIVEVLPRFASTERLNWMQWAACVGIAVPAWPMGWIVKRITVP